MKSRAILTFDLEFWYNANFLKKYLPNNIDNFDDYVEKSIEPILEILEKHNHKATFFVLGGLAKKCPDIIKKINDAGHEIGCHGYSHKKIDLLDAKEFEREIKKSKDVIEKIINKKLKGFRAPNFSLNKKTRWFLKILKKYNFEYDSSIHPLKLSRSFDQILEIPPSLGGFYFRITPLWLYVLLIKTLSKNPTLYFHPYELFKEAPKINYGPCWKRKVKYLGTKNAWKKFNKLMNKFDFISIENYLDENSFN